MCVRRLRQKRSIRAGPAAARAPITSNIRFVISRPTLLVVTFEAAMSNAHLPR